MLKIINFSIFIFEASKYQCANERKKAQIDL